MSRSICFNIAVEERISSKYNPDTCGHCGSHLCREICEATLEDMGMQYTDPSIVPNEQFNELFITTMINRMIKIEIEKKRKNSK